MTKSSDGNTGTSSIGARLRALPAVHVLLALPTLTTLRGRIGDIALTRAIRSALDAERTAIKNGKTFALDTLDQSIARHAEDAQASSLRGVINATGVVIHTNLGRAPLAKEARDAANEIAGHYSTLEYDLGAGRRGSRHGHVVALLQQLCGAEDACVVNNNAAAVLLALSAIAMHKEVIVSRGELVEIGGGFRIPDVMRQSGAEIVEVGTTNRTHPRDFSQALTSETGAILKVHQSNFAVVGFTTECSLSDLRTAIDDDGPQSQGDKPALLYDAGSGCLLPIETAPSEITVATAIAQGADLVLFSGDKLLGGPQAGIIAGRSDLVEICRRHPLMRALRPDKMCLAALEATLALWRDRPEAIPVRKMITTSREVVTKRARRLRSCLEADARIPTDASLSVVDTVGKIGGGTSPLLELKSAALRIDLAHAEAFAQILRQQACPVIARVEQGAVFIDLATVLEDEEDALEQSLSAALRIAGSDDVARTVDAAGEARERTSGEPEKSKGPS